MIINIDQPAGEGDLDQVCQRLCWPLRNGEGIQIARCVDFVRLNTFFLARSCLSPELAGLLAALQVSGVPCVVEVAAGNVTKKKTSIGLAASASRKR